MKKAMYPGTFDPITIGHLDVIERAAGQVDELHVVVATNVHKKVSFTVEQRIDFVKRATAHIKNLIITQTDELVVRYAEKHDIPLLFRGLRNIQDYENEYMLYQFNKNINPKVETMILFPSSRNHFVSSSAIKELIYHQADIRLYIPEAIVEDVIKKLSQT